MKKINTILNTSLVFLFSLTVFSYTTINSSLSAGYENAGGYIEYVSPGACNCLGFLTPFISVGPNGGRYIDPPWALHYERGPVGSDTLTHISKTAMPTTCLVVRTYGCSPHFMVPSGRIIIFGGTAKK